VRETGQVLVEGTRTEADAILRAMRDVATAAGTEPLTDADRAAVVAAHHYVFRNPGTVDAPALAPIAPAALADAVQDAKLREHAVGFLVVMACVDATIDERKIDLVSAYARSMDVDTEAVRQLAAAATGRLQWALGDMSRQNLISLTGHVVDEDANHWLLPYADAPDPALAARYSALGQLPVGTLGRTFSDFYTSQNFRFAGDPKALNQLFATAHDTTHILSGYSTSPQGELLVSTFTAGMHPHEPVSGHILPVLFSWHLGIRINDVAGDFTGAMDPEKFWVAWTRGSAVCVDVFDPAWDFWGTVEEPVDSLRARYEVPPLDPALAAEDRTPDWYEPIA
jgi:hypothetical protein